MNEDKYNPMSLAEILDGPTTIDWIVDGIIPPNSAGILAGHPGVGKTWFTIELAICVATGTSWFGQFNTKQGTVLVVDEENAELLLRVRLLSLLKNRGVNIESMPLHFLVGKAINFSPVKTRSAEHKPTKSLVCLFNTVKELQPSLIIFDSLTRIHHSRENDSAEMSSVFANVKRLMDDTGAACLFNHHMRKGGSSGQGIRGSSDILAFADYTLLVEKRKGGIIVTHNKSRWSEPIVPFGVGFNISLDAISFSYEGEKPENETDAVWDFLCEELFKGEKDRATLIQLADEQNICSQRTLDKILKWRSAKGFLEKDKSGKRVIYSLSEDTLERLDGYAATDEIAAYFQSRENHD